MENKLQRASDVSEKKTYQAPYFQKIGAQDTEFKTVPSPSEHATINNSFGPS